MATTPNPIFTDETKPAAPLLDAGTKADSQAALVGILAGTTAEASARHDGESRKGGRPKGSKDTVQRKLPPQCRPRNPVPAGEVVESALAEAEAALSAPVGLAAEEGVDPKTAAALVDFAVEGFKDLRGEIVRFAAKMISGSDKVAAEAVRPISQKKEVLMREGGILLVDKYNLRVKSMPELMFFGPMVLTLLTDAAKLRMIKSEADKNQEGQGNA
jgi:hypothetical protein